MLPAPVRSHFVRSAVRAPRAAAVPAGRALQASLASRRAACGARPGVPQRRGRAP